MDRSYMWKKIVDLSEEELISLRFLGDNASLDVKAVVETIRANPTYLGNVTCFMVDCVQCDSPSRNFPESLGLDVNDPPKNSPPSLDVPALSESETIYSQLSKELDAFTVVAPNLISKFEMHYWYHGISSNPPKLLWRSDFETNPFPISAPGTHFFEIPSKTVHGVFGTRLNAVWDSVAPQILTSLKAHGVKYSALSTVRFAIAHDGGEETLGPVVVWIAVPPMSTTAQSLKDVTPDILHILTDAQITGVVVEWYEGLVQRLVDRA